MNPSFLLDPSFGKLRVLSHDRLKLGPRLQETQIAVPFVSPESKIERLRCPKSHHVTPPKSMAWAAGPIYRMCFH